MKATTNMPKSNGNVQGRAPHATGTETVAELLKPTVSSVSARLNAGTVDARTIERLTISHARKLARQRVRRKTEVRIDYRPGLAAQRVLRHYQGLGIPLDVIIDNLVQAVGIRSVTQLPEDFRKRR